MAYNKKTANVSNDVTEMNVQVENVDTQEVKTNHSVVDTKPQRVIDPEETIPCRSITNGGLYIEGNRSKILYSWADYGDVEYVEYRDLQYMIRTRGDSNIYLPRIIIEDEDVIEQNKSLKELYESLYSVGDLRDIINLPANRMKTEIEKLPVGVKEALKGVVSTMIDARTLDSVQKIKILDEIFGTQMLLTLAQE